MLSDECNKVLFIMLLELEIAQNSTEPTICSIEKTNNQYESFKYKLYFLMLGLFLRVMNLS